MGVKCREYVGCVENIQCLSPGKLRIYSKRGVVSRISFDSLCEDKIVVAATIMIMRKVKILREVIQIFRSVFRVGSLQREIVGRSLVL